MRGQRNAILKHFILKGDLTSMQAFELYGCTRLAAIIHDFREMGIDIITVDQYGKNRYGGAVKYALYVMPPEERKYQYDKIVSDKV